ncbi:DUF6789 family protein [Halobacterium zhouii]|uniref:DUF6789 family protein n=1 Tax=Halobacterium zhouii TaxID=2902624 RepID=UPI001E36D4F7|nr:DUF6789 family protein [Halobacterium zhouii]
MKDWRAAIVAGVPATAVLILVLLASDVLTGTEINPFQLLAGFVGLNQQFLGFVLFVLVGIFGWPLMFLSFAGFLPGGTDAGRGLVFSIVLWVGFISAFAAPFGDGIVTFLVASLLAHVAYGVVLGGTYDRLAVHDIGEV